MFGSSSGKYKQEYNYVFTKVSEPIHQWKYRISRPIRRTSPPPEKCDLNSTCVLCAEGKYNFQTYKYPYIYYTTSLSWDIENNHEDDFSGIDDDFLGFYDD